MPNTDKKETNSEEPEIRYEGTIEDADLKAVHLEESTAQEADPANKPKLKKGRWAFLKTKKFLIPAAIVLVIAVLLAIPFTRYALLSNFVKRSVSVSVQDSKTNKPVTGVEVSLAGQNAKTDQHGAVTFSQVPAGYHQIIIKKQHYKNADQQIEVPVLGNVATVVAQLEATGRQVPIKVINRLTGKPIEKATVTVNETATLTDANGEATVVLPADKPDAKAAVTADGYNKKEVTVLVTEQKDDKNTFQLTPAGKIYFLSKRTGKIDVMKSNLDGTEPQVVLAGTGREEEDTTLLASRDWRYLALKARREGDQPKLYLIDTSNDKLRVMDEGNAEFTLSGWYNEYFTFKVDRKATKDWQPKKYALKSFNAKTGKLTTLDETTTDGNETEYNYQNIGLVYILENELVYTKDWLSSYQYGAWQKLANKKLTINSVRPDGTGKKVIREFQENTQRFTDAITRLYKPQELYIGVRENGDKYIYYEYEEGQLKAATDVNDEKFSKYYPTFLVSPSGQKTFWSEPRDGKEVLLVGNAHGDDAKEVGKLSEFTPYGWFTDEYLLVSKKGSELWILPVSGSEGDPSLKITDYHRPDYRYFGYGYGYGGL